MSSGRTAAAAGLWRVNGVVISPVNATGCYISLGSAGANASLPLICNAHSHSPTDLRLGGGIGAESSASPAEFGNGEIGEVLVWTRALAPAEAALALAYLALRWLA